MFDACYSGQVHVLSCLRTAYLLSARSTKKGRGCDRDVGFVYYRFSVNLLKFTALFTFLPVICTLWSSS